MVMSRYVALSVLVVVGCAQSVGRGDQGAPAESLIEIVGFLRDTRTDSSLSGFVFLSPDPFGESWWPNAGQAVVDSDGRFAFTSLRPQTYHLGAMSAGYEQLKTTVGPRASTTWVVELRLTRLLDSTFRGHPIRPPGSR
jgi:hypothetical protein